MNPIEQLIKALQIAAKYLDKSDFPTHCEHDELYLMLDPDIVSDEDKKELEELGFNPDDCTFRSFRFGSA